MLEYEEARRQRQRLHVRRSYHRKLNKIHAIRDMARQLTEQHHTAIARQEQLLRDKLQDSVQLEASRTRALQLYMEASKLSDQLRRENEELQLLVEEREKLEMKLSNVASDFGVGKVRGGQGQRLLVLASWSVDAAVYLCRKTTTALRP